VACVAGSLGLPALRVEFDRFYEKCRRGDPEPTTPLHKHGSPHPANCACSLNAPSPSSSSVRLPAQTHNSGPGQPAPLWLAASPLRHHPLTRAQRATQLITCGGGVAMIAEPRHMRNICAICG
jgi:hypothetical protein